LAFKFFTVSHGQTVVAVAAAAIMMLRRPTL
jgi:hypothetical protein